MRWFVFVIAVVILFNTLPEELALLLSLGWLIWLIVLAVKKPRNPAGTFLPPIYQDLARLRLLRHHLSALHQRGELDDARYQSLLPQLDQAEDSLCGWWQTGESRHQQDLEAAWNYLDSTGNVGAAPWVLPERVEPRATTPSAVDHPPIPSVDPAPVRADAAQTPDVPNLPPQIKQITWRDRLSAFLHHSLMPFVWQNIGWFIGVFLFVSGSIFLVAQTSGFAKALAVTLTLGLYIVLLLWGAYHLRRQRPELVASTSVLLTLGALLVPLDIAAALRMILGADGALQYGIGLGLSLFLIAVFSYAMRLLSGLLDRALIREQPLFFILLSSLQGGLLLLHGVPEWGLLAMLHGVIFAILAYALHRFGEHWLQAIFVEQRILAYYAAGTLIYAALVSFVHLAWAAPFTLPAGYGGPFVMALCGLLFYADSQIKRWQHQSGGIAYLGFAIYALSAVAVLLAWQGGIWGLVLTLALAVLLYGAMLWHYLSLPPLYLLLASSACLYALLVLRHFPASGYFLLSLPGFVGLLQLQAFARRRQSVALATVVYRVSISAVLGLVGWSLLFGAPGLAAMLTPLSAAVLLLYLLGLTPRRALQSATFGVYLLAALLALSLAYAPLWFNWYAQFSLALVGLSIVMLGLGVASPLFSAIVAPHAESAPAALARAWLHSALAALLLALTLAFYGTPPSFWLWLSAAAVILLNPLAWALKARSLIYAAFALSAVLGATLKQQYFPGPSVGWLETGGVMLLWGAWRGVLALAPPSSAQPQRRQLHDLYATPLYHASVLLFGYVLVMSGWRFMQPWLADVPVNPWLGVTLVALLPLTMLLGTAWLRGLLLPLLASLAIINTLLSLESGSNASLGLLLLQAWAVLIWASAYFLLPRLNARWPRWAIVPHAWPWLGLLLMLGCLGYDSYLVNDLHWYSLLALSVYLLLMWHSTALALFAWGAVMTFIAASLLGLAIVLSPNTNREWLALFSLILLYFNLLLALPGLWRRLPYAIPLRIALAAPLYYLPLLGIDAIFLALLGFSLFSASSWWLFGSVALLVLSLGHLLWLRPGRLAAHLLIISTLLLLHLTGFGLAAIMTLWTLLLAAWVWSSQRLADTAMLLPLRQALWGWLGLSFLVSAGMVLSNPVEHLGGLLLLSAIALLNGLLVESPRAARGWLTGSGLLGLFALHVLWIVGFATDWIALLPWYALQAAGLANLASLPAPTWLPARLRESRQRSVAALLALAMVLWLAHGVALMNAAPVWFGALGNSAAVVAILLILRGNWRQVTVAEQRIYIGAVLLGLLAVYLRVWWVGNSAVTVWDTALLMLAAYAVLIIHHRSPSPAWYRLTLLLPALAVLSTLGQSSHISLVLLASGALYLLMRREHSLPIYLGLLALNAAVYGWIPALATQWHLLQLYTIPAALTVLTMVHLHVLELRPQVAHAVRLVALTSLYASASLDVFLRPELSIFILALGLSLVGVILGIALRMRAFLYAGTVFLVFNVVGQLVQFYPDAGLGRALVLMVLGGLVTAGMIGFNVQRERIMQRLHLARADLAQWQ